VIADFAKVSLIDGSLKAAIDLNAGGNVMVLRQNRPMNVPIQEKTIENHMDVVCLILANGQKLIGSRDQKISVQMGKRTWFRQMAEVEVGDFLNGKIHGMPVVIRVVGVMYNAKQMVRLVGFRFQEKDVYLVENILCR